MGLTAPGAASWSSSEAILASYTASIRLNTAISTHASMPERARGWRCRPPVQSPPTLSAAAWSRKLVCSLPACIVVRARQIVPAEARVELVRLVVDARAMNDD